MRNVLVGPIGATMTTELYRDGSPRIDPTVLALLQMSEVAGRFDDALAFATTSSRCVDIAAAIGDAVKKLIDAQDRALDKANQF